MTLPDKSIVCQATNSLIKLQTTVMPRDIHPDIVRRILDARLAFEANLGNEQSVTELAGVAKMSPFHFQRTFRRVVGESVAKHIRRLRLERAAFDLRCSESSVTEISLDSGFDSHAGFTHAFTKLFGMSPSAYRERREVRPFVRRPREGRPTTDQDALARCPLTVTLVDVPDRTLAVMRYVGATAKLPTIWPKMTDWCRSRDLLTSNAQLLGLHHDDWETSVEDSYRYDAAIVVEHDFKSDGEATVFHQPGGLVAMTAFEGSIVGLDRTWQMFARDWLPASGYQFQLSHVYDMYPTELVSGSILNNILRSLNGIQATLCIPVSRDWTDN